MHSLNELWWSLSMCYNHFYLRNCHNLRELTQNRLLITKTTDLTERDFLIRLLLHVVTVYILSFHRQVASVPTFFKANDDDADKFPPTICRHTCISIKNSAYEIIPVSHKWFDVVLNTCIFDKIYVVDISSLADWSDSIGNHVDLQDDIVCDTDGSRLDSTESTRASIYNQICLIKIYFTFRKICCSLSIWNVHYFKMSGSALWQRWQVNNNLCGQPSCSEIDFLSVKIGVENCNNFCPQWFLHTVDFRTAGLQETRYLRNSLQQVTKLCYIGPEQSLGLSMTW